MTPAKPILIGVIVCVSVIGNTVAACTMTYEKGEPDSFTGSCFASEFIARTLNKTVRWNIYVWNSSSQLERSALNYPIGGSGQCYANITCWPDFYAPTVITLSGSGTIGFEERVRSYIVDVDTNSCNISDDTTYDVVMNCDEELQSTCPPGQTFNQDANGCCADPPPTYECEADLPDTQCPYTIDQWGCWPTPILIDVTGVGFQMSDAVNGVDFDIDGNPDCIKERLSWTAPGSDNAFLALDRNDNGIIDNGRELFGNYAPQPASPHHNGFLALAEYDTPGKGGNGNGLIDAGDDVFSRLRLWQDIDHDGISDATELRELSFFNIDSISLNYKEAKRTDEFGNRFNYRAKVHDARPGRAGRWAWDVVLLSQ